VRHAVTVSALQDFVGITLSRDVVLENDVLTLTAPGASFGGAVGAAVLEWRRADAAGEGDEP
jgi:hypothetical protein